MDNISDIVSNPLIIKIIIAIIGIIIISVIKRIVSKTLPKMVHEDDTKYRIRKMITFSGFVIQVILLSIIFKDRLGGITVAFGVAGAGVAFALQEVIASTAGWVALSFGDFYHIGNRVQLGGIKGDVIDIGVLRTTIMECGEWVKGDLYTGRVVRVANSFVFKEPVFNYSGDFPFLWDEIIVPVKYGCDHKYSKQTLERISNELLLEYAEDAQKSWHKMKRKFLLEEQTTKPMITLVANDNWMEFTIRYVVDFKKRRTTKDMLFMRILDEIEISNGKMSLASATFELVAAPDLNIKMNNKMKEENT